jgi:flagellar biosynthesis/type III secretory pathway chaperone
LSVQQIMELMEQLVDVHKQLLSISKEKTERFKEGAIEPLQQLLVKERKQIRLLEQTESKRQQAVEKWFQTNGMDTEQYTVSHMLEKLEDEKERETLANITTTLTETIVELKQQEQLNEALIRQSMEFVQMSLDLMNPNISSMNYGKEMKENTANRSLFDSQA